MVVKKKVQKSTPMIEDIESAREAVISQGGHVKSDGTEKKKWKTICLRLPEILLEKADEEVEKRIGFNRNAWILEAIQEKIRKEKIG